MKENYGDLKELAELGKNKKNSYTTEQLIDKNLKNTDGENRIEVTSRMEEALNFVISQSSGKNIAIVSHGASIKFLLMKWCSLNKNNQIEFNGQIITLNSPGIIELLYKGEKLVQLTQIL